MLHITVPAGEFLIQETSSFVYTRQTVLQLEHSLVSLSKWESKWKKPFLSAKEKTGEELLHYVQCMNMTQNVEPLIYKLLTAKDLREIGQYIEDPMTATTFSKVDDKPTNKEIITAEIIYYWMITFNIPFECQKWHLNRLLTLVNVCMIKNQKQQKIPTKEQLKRNKALNDLRKAQLGTSG